MHRRNVFHAVSSLTVCAALLVVAFTAYGWRAPGKTAPAAGDWQATEAVSYENLSIFPVLSRESAATSSFLTLDEALASGDAVVSELGSGIIRRTRDRRGSRPWPEPQGAEVNRLVLVNRSQKPLLLLAGEIVSGGKQDRVVAKDRIVPPDADPLPLDVFCVERGRWAGGSFEFAASKLMAHPSVREKAAVDQDQSEVWAAVRSGSTAPAARASSVPSTNATAIPTVTEMAVADAIAAEARTESYGRIYKGSRIGSSVEAFAEELQRRLERATKGIKDGRVVGVVVAFGGEMAWADVFASAELFQRYWPKLLRSYAVEALARPKSTERAALDDARDFLTLLAGRSTVESEPDVYRWEQVTSGRYAQIALESLQPKPLLLHWVKIHRTS